MVLRCFPDFAQEVMKNTFCDDNDAKVYKNDVGVFSNYWKEHRALLCRI